LIATIGVNDLIVVRTHDATLVCHKDHSQSVKKVVAALAAHPHRRKLL
jgi:mannose-1-phosphate guanylyltransferase